MRVPAMFVAALAALLLFAASSTRAAVTCSDPAQQQPKAVPSDWWRLVEPAIAADEYVPAPRAHGLEAPNRAQNLRIHFDADRVVLEPRVAGEQPAWHYAWRLERWGRVDACRDAIAPIEGPRLAGARVTYARGDLLEWYENGAAGLEQGFTIALRPEGDGPLVLAGESAGTLRAVTRGGDAIAFLDGDGDEVLRYDALRVADAGGRTLPARLSLDGATLSLVIDDGGATYPLTVDPVLTSPAWTKTGDQASAYFGCAVATAGDVNGDGYSDVIVGASDYDNGETNEGRAYVFLGSASGLSSTPAWTVESNQTSALLGFAVGPAGDVNGDGYDDVIVGAPYATNGQTNEGRAYVYLGSTSGLAATPVWTGESDQANAHFGSSVCTAGDVNGDGYWDIVVGARDYTNGQTSEGRAYVFYGSASGPAATAGWTFEPNVANAQAGWSVSTAGDVNGDNCADVLVGSRSYTNGESNEGCVWLFLGSSSGLLPGAAWSREGGQAGAQFGFSVGNAGDTNGDGYADIIIGAPGYDNGQADEGRAFVFYGSSSGIGIGVGWTAESNQASAYFGFSVGTAGDVNGDGYADVVVGAYAYDLSSTNEGGVFVYEGSATGPGMAPVATLVSGQANAWLGYAVGTAGDVNGDGYSDIIAGAPYLDATLTDVGRAYVWYGTAAAPDTASNWSYIGTLPSGLVGTMVASAGDVNGDGYSDLMITQPANGYSGNAYVYVFYGSRTGYAPTPSWWYSPPTTAQEFRGFGSAGDVNGDGYSDVLVEAKEHLLLFLGSASGLAAAPAWTFDDGDTYGRYISSAGSAGDVNGDGFGDIIVGNPGFHYANGPAGHAMVFLGCPSGLMPTPYWLLTGGTVDAVHDLFDIGLAVGTAGDVDGDGYSDIVVTAHGQPAYPAVAIVYHGSSSGFHSAPDWFASQPPGDFGVAACAAGDVNGDGYSDLLVGSPRDWVNDRGAVFVYHGSATGLGASPARVLHGSGIDHARFGVAVSSAGDVNGDGYSDVLVGEPYFYDPADSTKVGRAYLFLGSASGVSATPVWSYVDHGTVSTLGAAVASPGDANGDGFADIAVGSPYYRDSNSSAIGRVQLFYGNGGGLDRVPQQRTIYDTAPIALTGASDSRIGFRVKGLGRSAAGRGLVRPQFEVKPFGTPFDALSMVTGPWFDTGSPTTGGSRSTYSLPYMSLAENHTYHWRVHLFGRSPYFPRTPWFSVPGNAPSEMDLRSARNWAGVSGGPPAGIGVRLVATPNPFASATRIAYTLPTAGRVRVEVFACSGSSVSVLANGSEPAGEHVALWDGTDTAGRRLAPGVYMVRLAFRDQSATRKVVILR